MSTQGDKLPECCNYWSRPEDACRLAVKIGYMWRCAALTDVPYEFGKCPFCKSQYEYVQELERLRTQKKLRKIARKPAHLQIKVDYRLFRRKE